jgi:hypothetical protein
MKSQIALIGIGLVIAAAVAYAELKPTSNTPNAPIVATPQPSSTTPQPSSTPTKTKITTKAKTPAPKISKPSVSGGGGGENDEGNEGND